MPDGMVQWFDPVRGEAAIARRGRVLHARIEDVEPAARHAGARVHYDVTREQGVERATSVALRRGTRVSPRQADFGTLTGARTPDAKRVTPVPAGTRHPPDGHTHPLDVARVWARLVTEGDVEAALALYAPDAVVHGAGGDVAGPAHLRVLLESAAVTGSHLRTAVRGADGTVVVRWEGSGDVPPAEARLRLEHGMIVEEWTGPPEPEEAAAGEEAGLPVTAVTTGAVTPDDVAYARVRVAGLAEKVGEPVLFARVKLTHAPDPARERPALAQVLLDVNGRPVRAHVAARSMREAVDLVERRLYDKLQHRAEHLDALRKTPPQPEPGEWWHGALPTHRPEFFDRPEGERELVRHKAFAVEALTPDEAAFDMEQLDYGFYLFEDLASGEDSVLERLDDGGFRMTRLHPATPEPAPGAVPVEVVDVAAPELGVDEAIERLDTTAEPFVFFADVDTGHGAVVYRRYDGHYGLITRD